MEHTHGDEGITISDAEIDERQEQTIMKRVNKGALSILRFRKCKLEAASFARIFQGLKRPSRLVEVDLNECSITGHVLSAFYQNKVIPSTLILDGIGLDDEGITPLVEHMDRLEFLCLRNNRISSKGVVRMFGSANFELRFLDLANNEIDDAAALVIRPCAKAMDLSGNKFSSHGLQVLCSNLGTGRVRRLHMNDMRWDSATPSVGKLYRVGSSVRELYLRNCSLKGMPKITEGSGLTLLDLTGSTVGEITAPESVMVIGGEVSTRSRPRILIEFPEFERIHADVESLVSQGEVEDRDGKLVDALTEVSDLMGVLKTKLGAIRRKVQGRKMRGSLSAYAAKVVGHRDSLRESLFDSNAVGVTLDSQFSLWTKMQLVVQYLTFVRRLEQRNVYITKFDPKSFVWTSNSVLILRDPSVLGTSKSDCGVPAFLSDVIGFNPAQCSPLHSVLLASVTLRSGKKNVHAVDRTFDSIMGVFKNMESYSLVTAFQFSVNGEDAVDHGGVMRDVLTCFWNDTASRMFEMSDVAVTLLPAKGDFKTLGRIMVKCLSESIPAPIPLHSIVFRFICDQMPINLEQWVESLAEFDPQLAANIAYEASGNNEICERCKEILVDRRIDQLREMKKGMLEVPIIGSIVRTSMEWWSLAREFVGEVEWSGAKIVDEIMFVGFSRRSKAVWTDAIEKFSKSDISHFVRLVTGIASIPSGGFVARGKHLVISKSDRLFAHTCSFELESPSFRDSDSVLEILRVAFVSLDANQAMNEWYR